MPMLKMLAPRTTRPPSWKTRAWTATTLVITSVPTHGPRRMAARTPPTMWPLVPPATGKLTIWAAKMKAAVTPMSGTARSSRLAAAALHRDGQHDDGDAPHERRDGDRQEAVRGVKREDGNEPGAPGIKGREHGEMLVAIARCCKSL